MGPPQAQAPRSPPSRTTLGFQNLPPCSLAETSPSSLGREKREEISGPVSLCKNLPDLVPREQADAPVGLSPQRLDGAPAQLAQDLRFSGLLWLRSTRSAAPSPLARAAVSDARLVAEPERVALRRGSGAPCSRRPALRRRPGPAALRTRPGLTSSP